MVILGLQPGINMELLEAQVLRSMTNEVHAKTPAAIATAVILLKFCLHPPEGLLVPGPSVSGRARFLSLITSPYHPALKGACSQGQVPLWCNGLVASLQCQDTSSIPRPAQLVKGSSVTAVEA